MDLKIVCVCDVMQLDWIQGDSWVFVEEELLSDV